MLLFHKKDLLVVLTKDDDTVEFSKPIKDILKYQHRYNYKFKLYETGKITVADDYIIEGETLTVFFGTAYVEYSSSGATYNDGGGSGGSGGEGGCEDCVKIITLDFVDIDIQYYNKLYAYTSEGWVDLIETAQIATVFNTTNDIPNAFVYAPSDAPGVSVFPSSIYKTDNIGVTGETHIPETTDPRGYYIKYSDDYCIVNETVDSSLLLQNGEVVFHEGLA